MSFSKVYFNKQNFYYFDHLAPAVQVETLSYLTQDELAKIASVSLAWRAQSRNVAVSMAKLEDKEILRVMAKLNRMVGLASALHRPGLEKLVADEGAPRRCRFAETLVLRNEIQRAAEMLAPMFSGYNFTTPGGRDGDGELVVKLFKNLVATRRVARAFSLGELMNPGFIGVCATEVLKRDQLDPRTISRVCAYLERLPENAKNKAIESMDVEEFPPQITLTFNRMMTDRRTRSWLVQGFVRSFLERGDRAQAMDMLPELDGEGLDSLYRINQLIAGQDPLVSQRIVDRANEEAVDTWDEQMELLSDAAAAPDTDDEKADE
jgi:hypothetical protein